MEVTTFDFTPIDRLTSENTAFRGAVSRKSRRRAGRKDRPNVLSEINRLSA